MIISPPMLHFDTHQFVKAFLAAKSEEAKAEVIAESFVKIGCESEIKLDKAKDELATKSDIQELKSDLKILESELKVGLKSGMSGLKAEMNALETKLTNKLYLVIGGQAVFMTSLILGVLPYMLK